MSAGLTLPPSAPRFDPGADRSGDPGGTPDAARSSGPDAGQTRTPLADLLTRELPGRARWTVPGHMGGRCAPPRALQLLGEPVHAADLWPDQERYAEALADAEALAARAWGAGGAHLLTGGATTGNLAWVFASLRVGDTVIVDSACHVSILTGLRLRPGVRPVWVERGIDPDLGIPLPLDPAAVGRALRRHPEARQVIVTSPTYAGTGSPVRAVAGLAHAAGVMLYVDAAWAPHGRWAPGGGLDPMASGADACVVSLHKTGAALSGAAVLLTAAGLGAAQEVRVGLEVTGLRSTSPLLPVLASGDLARAALASAGREGVARAIGLAADLRGRCEAVPGVHVLAGGPGGGPPDGSGRGVTDPLKLVLDVSAGGCTGFEVQRRLRTEGVLVEGADLQRLYLVLPATIDTGGVHEDAHRVLPRALGRVMAGGVRQGAGVAGDGGRGRGLRVSPSVWAASRGEQVMLPSEAGEHPGERVPLERAVGCIAVEHAAPYPPGVPIWVPGERITREAVAILRDVGAAGGVVHGPWDSSARTVAVVRA